MCEPYETLGVTASASGAEIHAAFRRLALQWHPDRNPNPIATCRFQEIAAAYDVLKDPERRARDDATRVRERREQFRQQHRDDPYCPCRPSNPEAERIWAEAEAAMRITPEAVVNLFGRVEGLLRNAFAKPAA